MHRQLLYEIFLDCITRNNKTKRIVLPVIQIISDGLQVYFKKNRGQQKDRKGLITSEQKFSIIHVVHTCSIQEKEMLHRLSSFGQSVQQLCRMTSTGCSSVLLIRRRKSLTSYIRPNEHFGRLQKEKLQYPVRGQGCLMYFQYVVEPSNESHK